MMAEPGFWETNGKGQNILKERASLLEMISTWKEEKKEIEEMEIFLQLIEEQEDEGEEQELLEKIRRAKRRSASWNLGGCWEESKTRQRDCQYQCRCRWYRGPGLG
jgi:hypothetical protein